MATLYYQLMGLFAVAAVIVCIVIMWQGGRAETEHIYYDPDEALPATPQPWGIDDYQPWPGLYDNPEEEIEAVTVLWNEATNEGDTVLASALFDEYERLCREYR